MFLWLNQLAQAVKLYNQMRHVDHESQWRHYGSIKLTSTRAKGVPWRSILITSNNPFQFSTIVTCAIETVRSKCGCRDPSEFFFHMHASMSPTDCENRWERTAAGAHPRLPQRIPPLSLSCSHTLHTRIGALHLRQQAAADGPRILLATRDESWRSKRNRGRTPGI
jgi:hypothetical protein